MNTTRPEEWPKSGWYWHLHHDRLIEWTDNIDERWDYVVREKPAEELEDRLRLMRPVLGEVPEQLVMAYAEWQRAHAEWQRADAEWQRVYAEWKRARAEWQRADAEWQRADDECMPSLLALHTAECPDCPWDGESIFPKRVK